MAQSEHRQLIERFVACMNQHDVDGLAACYARDAVIRYPGRAPQSPDEYSSGERAMLESVPDYAIEPLSMLEADDGHVILELRMSGTQRAELGGRSFSITGAYVFQIVEGLIVEERAYPDLAGLRSQLRPQ